MAISNSTDRLNGLVAGLAVKVPCKAVAIANITLSGEQTVNGVPVVSGDRVLVTAQTSAVNNGIYDVSSAAWTRSPDFDGNRDVVSGTFVTVATATVGRNPYYQVTTANPITIGTTGINFTLADGPNVSIAITAEEITAGLTAGNITDSFHVGDLKRYGAVLDGAVDDTTAVTNWLKVGFEGVALSHPGGTALCSTWVILSTTGNLIMYSNAGGVIDTASVAFIKVLHDIDIEGVRFANCKSVFSNVDTDTSTIDIISIKWCLFTSCEQTIDMERGFNSLDISHNRWKTCTGDGCRIGRNIFAEQDNWQRMVIDHNVIDGLTALAATDVRGFLLYGKNVTFSHNIMEGIVGVSGQETHGLFTKVRGLSVVGNVVIAPSIGTTVSCFNIKGNNRASSGAPQGFSGLVSGNVAQCGGTANGIRARSDDILVVGNIVDDPLLCGIDTGTGDFHRININSNRIYGTNRASSIGIRMTHDTDQIEAIGNEIHDFVTGIRASCDTAKTPTGFKISENSLFSCTTGINVNAPAVITGLEIVNNYMDTGTNAIRFDGTGPDDVTIKGNKVIGYTDEISWGASSAPTNVEIDQVYRRQTTDATVLNVFSQPLPDNSAYRIETQVTAMETDGSDRALYHKQGLVFRDGGGATIQGAIADVITDIESDAAWDSDVTVGSNDVRMRFTGAAAETINWVGRLKLDSLI